MRSTARVGAAVAARRRTISYRAFLYSLAELSTRNRSALVCRSHDGSSLPFFNAARLQVDDLDELWRMVRLVGRVQHLLASRTRRHQARRPQLRSARARRPCTCASQRIRSVQRASVPALTGGTELASFFIEPVAASAGHEVASFHSAAVLLQQAAALCRAVPSSTRRGRTGRVGRLLPPPLACRTLSVGVARPCP